jgi:hypothetical protein
VHFTGIMHLHKVMMHNVLVGHHLLVDLVCMHNVLVGHHLLVDLVCMHNVLLVVHNAHWLIVLVVHIGLLCWWSTLAYCVGGP